MKRRELKADNVIIPVMILVLFAGSIVFICRYLEKGYPTSFSCFVIFARRKNEKKRVKRRKPFNPSL
jgi:hypothetical protein